jgi:hypothetical protein
MRTFSGRATSQCCPPLRRRRELEALAVIPGGAVAALHRDEIGFADKAGHEPGPRLRIEHLRPIELLDPAVVHDGDAIRHGDRLALVVRHIDGRHAEPAVQAAQLDLHVLAQTLVEGRQRLVHQHDARLEHDGAGQRDPLPLPAGELVDAPVGQAAELHQVQRLVHPRLGLSRRGAPLLERKGDVVEHVHVREQRVVLEHHADVALVRGMAMISSPPTFTLPALARTKPARIISSVVLPEPEGPARSGTRPVRRRDPGRTTRRRCRSVW